MTLPGLAFITGATAGFGEAIARRFVHEGWRVVATGRRADRLELLRQELGAAKCHVARLDVTDRQAVEQCLSSLPEEFRAIDVVVNNAGLALGIDTADIASLDDWDVMVDTNIKGLMYVTRTLLPQMIARGRGHVINLGSVAGEWPYPGGNCYGATKAFVRQFSHNLRADLAGKNVRITDVEPGLAVTEFSLVRFKGDAARAENVYKGAQPLTAADVADAVFWVATRPPHVNVNRLELMPTCQSYSALTITRDTTGNTSKL